MAGQVTSQFLRSPSRERFDSRRRGEEEAIPFIQKRNMEHKNLKYICLVQSTATTASSRHMATNLKTWHRYSSTLIILRWQPVSLLAVPRQATGEANLRARSAAVWAATFGAAGGSAKSFRFHLSVIDQRVQQKS